MIRAIALAALLLAPALAHAQQPKQPPEMVLIPRAAAEAAAQWIVRPDAGNAVRLYAMLSACIADNPVGGVVRRVGVDQCPEVTAALAARDAELAAAKKPAPQKEPH
jgi:hypothetical protein